MRQLNRAQGSVTEGSARELIVVAFAVPVVTMLTIAVATLTVLLFAGSGLEGLGPAVGSMWLAIHQVPVTISGVTIGVLPLLPTILIAVGTARMAASASGPQRPTSELIAVLFSALGGPLLVTALSLAVVMDGTSVLPLQSPPALVAFAATLGIHGGAAIAGIGWRRRTDICDRLAVPASVRRGMRYGAAGVIALLTAAAAVVVVRLAMRWETVGDLIAGGNDLDGYLGLTVLSLLYLPNVIVAAAAVLIGADVHVGAAAVDLVDVQGGPVPPLPLLGVLPDAGVGTMGLLGFVVPASIAVVVGLRCRDIDPLANLRSVALAGAVAATAMVILCALAGGELGEFGSTGVTMPTVGVFTLGWFVVVGLVVGLIYAALPGTRHARRAAALIGLDEYDLDQDDGYDDEYLTDEYLTDDYYPEEYVTEEFGTDGYVDDDDRGGTAADGDDMVESATIEHDAVGRPPEEYGVDDSDVYYADEYSADPR
ncbi:hypothetical protein GIY30_15860 [Gordonia sp. HNM0687]|uniref:Uncharacterized protein n=1 Tax=Gordonia mangrovi TaxID=2665643 RepID=A0A6L7GTQ0_9ACTN|nr:DUF6350 family protein [Gordonia mangrovi]MXP22817.1 hypothetical protein [Gordonia mangrovi]UVF77129.1 DUF6350 family protein [Gordonia mangrovi]